MISLGHSLHILMIYIIVTILLYTTFNNNQWQCHAQPRQDTNINNNNNNNIDIDTTNQQQAASRDITLQHEASHAINPYAVTHITVDAIQPLPRWQLVQSSNQALIYPATGPSLSSSNIQSSYIVDLTSNPLTSNIRTFSSECSSMDGNPIIITYQQMFTPCVGNINGNEQLSSSSSSSSNSVAHARHCFISSIHLNDTSSRQMFNRVDVHSKCGMFTAIL